MLGCLIPSIFHLFSSICLVQKYIYLINQARGLYRENIGLSS